MLAAFVMTAGVTFGQDGKKSLKMASKSLSNYQKDPLNNGASLQEAKDYLAAAFEDEAVSSEPKSWLTRADIFYNIGDSQIKSKLLNPDFALTEPNAGVEALNSYQKALEIATKKGEKKNALSGIEQVAGLLNSFGVELYRLEDYKNAHNNFVAEIDAGMVLMDNEKSSVLSDESVLTNRYYFAGLTGFYADDYNKTIELLKKAIETGTDEPTIYQLLYEAHTKIDDIEGGVPFLQEGRKKYPSDTGLLFSEINYFLGAGKLDEMLGNLEKALEAEPDNSSVIQTMAQVYDQLQAKALEEGDQATADEYFNKALNFYSDAIARDAKNFDLQYSIGALYYNKAALLTPALNEVANDFSKAGSEKYDAIKDEMAAYFDKALPYFILADELNGKDRNTLIALKEIYARKDELDKSNIYKTRLEELDMQND